MSTNEIIKDLCVKRGITISALEKELGFANASLAKSPGAIKSDRLLAIAKFFGVSMEYLMGEEAEKEEYYYDPESAQYAEFLHKNPDYKVLFDASRKVKPEDIAFVREMIERTTNYGS